MKVIDLLNKIANNEEVPKKIKYKRRIYNYEDSDYFASDYGFLFDRYNASVILNDEIEIIEEKIPEKLNLDKDELRRKETTRAIDYLIEDKINSIIDYLKCKGE